MKAHTTNFGIENFRVFKNKTQFEFAPITILTGTNSSGKSSLINAMEIFKSGNNYDSGSNERPFWRLGVQSFIKEKFLFNRFKLETSTVDKRFGRFETFLNSKKENEILNYSFISKFNFFHSPVEIKLGYAQDKKEKGSGILKHISIIDIITKLEVLQIESIDENITVKIEYGYFFEKLIKYLNEEEIAEVVKEDYGDLTTTTISADSVSFFGEKESIKEKVKEIMENNIPFFEFQFEPVLKVGSDWEPYEAFDLNQIKEKMRIIFEQYPELNKDSSKALFISQQEMLYLSTFVFSTNDKEIQKSSVTSILNILSNPISLSKNNINVDSFISEVKQIEYAKFKFNEKFREELEFIFNDFIVGNIIKVFNDASLPTFDKLNTSRVNIQRSYSDMDLNDKNSFSSQIKKIDRILSDGDNFPNSYAISFINGALSKLDIADKMEIEVGTDQSSYLIYLTKSGRRTLLADVGFGISQVLSIIFLIATKIKDAIKTIYDEPDYGSSNNNFIGQTAYHNLTIVIEEPEASLHPANQSKMADIIVNAAKKTGIRFIIETHSEYLIRKLQYLTAKGEIKPEDTVIYYFYPPDDVPPGEEQVKKINITEDGSLTDDFGSGFFDEADKIAMSIWNMNKSQKN